MMSFKTLLQISSLLLLLTSSLASPALPANRNITPSSDILPEGYKMSPLKLRGNIPSIGNVSISGQDLPDILKKLKVQHPDFELAASNTTALLQDLSALRPRNKSLLNCCPVPERNWGWTLQGRIQTAYAQLFAMSGQRCGVEARSCSRLSCDQGDAIFLCNDNDYPIEPDCGYLASYARDISNTCIETNRYSPWTANKNCGQEFDTDNYSVIVTTQNCDAFNSHTSPML